jgi:hypothetical protein
MLKLSGIEVFFIVTTIVSVVINIVQFVKSGPVYNGICGLMTDCKVKAHYYEEVLKQYPDICARIIADLNGLTQHMYGLLKSMKSRDRTWQATVIRDSTTCKAGK